ncbi:hypothetical protein ACFFJ7_17520 [Pseudochelatococcus lubricantis]|uniref:hypothetical protein n=1 Tax=Pseudochelatococcus lubricantis TaxID=1538102 RepID=UPI0035ED132A
MNTSMIGVLRRPVESAYCEPVRMMNAVGRRLQAFDGGQGGQRQPRVGGTVDGISDHPSRSCIQDDRDVCEAASISSDEIGLRFCGIVDEAPRPLLMDILEAMAAGRGRDPHAGECGADDGSGR